MPFSVGHLGSESLLRIFPVNIEAPQRKGLDSVAMSLEKGMTDGVCMSKSQSESASDLRMKSSSNPSQLQLVFSVTKCQTLILETVAASDHAAASQ